MKLHEIENMKDAPFRRMKVESGYLYNAWDEYKQDWGLTWTFAPDSNERIRKLERHEATTIGLWATDRPDLVKDPKGIMFQITGI